MRARPPPSSADAAKRRPAPAAPARIRSLGGTTCSGRGGRVVSARWTALVLVAVLAAGVAGCGSSDRQGTDVRTVAFVAPYRDNEPDWTLQAQTVVSEWVREGRVRVD